MPVGDELNDELDEQEDENEEELEDQLDETEDESEDESEESDDSPKSKPDKSEKRIRDLQSALDKALAENNKLKKVSPADKKAPASRDPEVERWMRAAQDATRDRLYDSDPRFKEFGIDPAVISGDTPEEMKMSLRELTKLISRVETRVRNKTLREHGFSPPPKEGGAEPRRNIAGMSNEDFQKLVDEVSVG